LNRPGLTTIVFRVGTYSSFRLSMLQRIAGTQALSDLKTRSDDDYAITLLDMWATVANVLTFYQERIANESYLRTARQRDSILRMARMLDYHLRPGIAATTFLAFTLDQNSSVKIPVGLRVQSVPAENEQPQIFETLESILADSRFNSSRILPSPEGFNPLAKGSTSGLIAPGPEGLLAASAISTGNQLVLFSSSQLEELTVREIRTEEERVSLSWSGPIQNSDWTFDSLPMAFNRKFRVFGYNAPSQYMDVQEPAAGNFVWVRRILGNAEYIYTYLSANVLELDSKYEGIAVGSQLLISQDPASNQLVTVKAVRQGQATFGFPGAATPAVQDTVTQVTISPAPAISDRRKTVIYEITSPPIRFWGYRYPEKIGEARVLVPALRVDAETVEIGRTIENKAFKSGVQLPLKSIQGGREVILRDATHEPVLAKVTSVAAIGLDVSFQTTPDDLTTAIELRLTPEESEQLSGLRSSPLPASFTLTSSKRELSVTIGTLPARTITLAVAPTNLNSAATQLANSLRSSLPLVPEFAQSMVTEAGNGLIAFPGVPGLPITFGPTPDDPTTAGELGLVSPGAFRIDALLSGELSPFPTITSVLRELLVTFGPIGPRKLTLGPMSNLNSAEVELVSAISEADSSPAFNRVLVATAAGTQRMLILPGTGESSIRDFLSITLQPEAPLLLDASSAVLFGNVAFASHGEKVSDEVLGDGDASVAFQKFELQKSPLTYVPAAGPGGTESTLDVFVNDVLWSEVPSLFGQGSTDQVYITRLADDGKVTVGFGDGRAGARLPSGRGNVVADYRQGAGLGGRVIAGSLRNPLDLPVGLKSTNNPFPATGGADPESIEQARENAPTTVRTFGRAVSLRDFEDLSRASGEVAKALATWVWNREARAVHLTIAAQGGQLFSPSDLARIHASLSSQRDPNHALFLDNYSQVAVVVTATVRVESKYVASKVGEAARQSLLSALSFDSLRFGQPVSLSDIYAVLQQVEGVSSVDIDQFQFKDQSAAFLAARGATSAPVQRTLRIFSARPNSVPMPPALPAELATVQVPVEDIKIVTSGGLPD
jgi:hypothetical protein